MTFFIFPHQLFYNLNHLNKNDKIYLIEEPRYFTDFNFHKLKLAYHRASMKKYYDFLKKKKYNITYINFDKVNDFYKSVKNDNITIIYVNDFKLEHKLKKIFKKLIILENKNFLIKQNELEEIKKLIKQDKNKKYSHEEFYKYQRKKLNILIDSNNKPINGKWSFDNENRLPLPKNHTVIKTVTKPKKINI